MVDDLLRDTYVDDVQSGGETVEDVQRFKRKATQIMTEGELKLHEWHSNIQGLVEKESSDDATTSDNTYAKQIVGTGPKGTKMLGTARNEWDDSLAIIPGRIHRE